MLAPRARKTTNWWITGCKKKAYAHEFGRSAPFIWAGRVVGIVGPSKKKQGALLIWIKNSTTRMATNRVSLQSCDRERF